MITNNSNIGICLSHVDHLIHLAFYGNKKTLCDSIIKTFKTNTDYPWCAYCSDLYEAMIDNGKIYRDNTDWFIDKLKNKIEPLGYYYEKHDKYIYLCKNDKKIAMIDYSHINNKFYLCCQVASIDDKILDYSETSILEVIKYLKEWEKFENG